MSSENQTRVFELLRAMPEEGLGAAKRLFWRELNYDRASETIARRGWPQRAREALAADPVILAEHGSEFGDFHVIYAPLSEEQTGRAFPLSLTAERLVVTELLKNHPYALFLFSDTDETHWHLVNVKRDEAKATGGSEGPASSDGMRRRLFRRIAVGPYERLRTAAERVAMLDLTRLSPDLFGLSPLAIQTQHDESFDVEKVTKDFFERFARLFYRVRDEIAAAPGLQDSADDLAQMLLDRLLFLYFIQKKGWLAGDPDYLVNRFQDGHAGDPQATSFYGSAIYPLFLALSGREPNRELRDHLGAVPFLNGGLFDLSMSSSGLRAAESRLPVSNRTFGALFEELLEHYNFTVSEDTPLDQEVAIDPEMLGKIFESLVLEREQDPEVDLRKATGSYYTPRPIVAFMCREALAEYLAAESRLDREPIARLLDLPPADRLTDEERAWLQDTFSRAEADSLKNYLLDVRACDPAVGSGAFLIGLLQSITWAVGLVDWRLAGEGGVERRNYAYDLKKQVIEHCLYGVDIQAQAVQICELRLWLSLIVDYELPEGKPLTQALEQVPALPNLAYKVRQGDSLLERLFGQVVQLGALTRDRRTLDLIDDLQREKSSYYTLDSTPEKHRRELRILELQTALAGRLVETQKERLRSTGYQPNLLGEETAAQRREREEREAVVQALDELQARVEAAQRKLAQLQRETDHKGVSAETLRRQLMGDAEHPTFLWRVDFAEVFQEKGGFDVMIANPPYVRQEKIKHLKPDLKRVYPKVYHGVADIYVYFYAQGLRQLRNGGALAYISSNKFMRAGYGQTLRRLLGDMVTLRTVIDFGDLPVFEATTYPTVLVMAKRTPVENEIFHALTVDEIATVEHLTEVVQTRAWEQPQNTLGLDGWALIEPDVRSLLAKLRASGATLEEYVDGNFYRGIVTGLNKAFVIDQSTRDRIVAADSRSAEIIKPWLRGRDVKRWRIDWAGRYLVWTYQGVVIEDYPAILDYLTGFRQKLEHRWEPSHGQCEWYELRPCDYYSEFEKPKIVYPHFNTEPNFAYDDSGALSNDKTYIIPGASLFLLGLLNSHVTHFILRQLAPSVQQGYMEFRTIYVGQIPVPGVSEAQHIAIEGVVRKLLDAKGQGAQVGRWETELNQVVYSVYGLTDDEITIVEGQR